jgi:predicted nucleic acid-binding protein
LHYGLEELEQDRRTGEMNAVQLAPELGMEVVLIDERRPQGYAESTRLIALGSTGILEMHYRMGALERSLRDFKLPPLQLSPERRPL